MLNKAFDQIDASDIVELCARGAYESQLLEFKEIYQVTEGRVMRGMQGEK